MTFKFRAAFSRHQESPASDPPGFKFPGNKIKRDWKKESRVTGKKARLPGEIENNMVDQRNSKEVCYFYGGFRRTVP